jgi:hypothetical protein
MEGGVEQPGALNGLNRFLVAHGDCGAGFDVSHPSGLGGGKVRMTCRGCGRSYEYATATISFEREIEVEPLATAAPGPAAPGPTEPIAEPLPPPSESPRLAPPSPDGDGRRAPRRAARRTRERAIVAGLLVFAFAAIAFAAVRLGQTRSASSSSSTDGVPGAGSAAPSPKPAKQKAAPPPVAEKLVRTARFSLLVPRDWTRRAAGGGLLLSAPGGGATVRAFYESNPQMSWADMSEETARYLRSREPGGAVSGPTRLRVGGHQAFGLSDRGGSSAQTARGVLAGPYRDLVVAEVQPGASASARAAAMRAVRSFRPR